MTRLIIFSLAICALGAAVEGLFAEGCNGSVTCLRIAICF
jgi:hypothetical protein